MPTINAWNSNIPVELAKGGTNAISFGTSNGIVKYDGTRLVTSTATVNSGQIYQNPAQPAFSAYKSSTTNTVTGNGAYYSYICDGTNFNVGTSYNTSTGVFTAPIAGVYFFETNVLLANCLAASYIIVYLATTARTYQSQTARIAGTDFGWGISIIAQMAAGDTAFPTVYAAGEATNRDGVYGAAGSNYGTFFQGYLIC